jgi:NADH-quinone oxidoreductase subunit L
MFLIWCSASARWTSGHQRLLRSTPPAAARRTAIGLLLLVGACGKSAQIPLHVWLPDAMAGPTPVSALIHAATMVTAGVYLLSRLSGLFLATPDAMMVVAWLGGLTALVGATMGVTQFNLKKVLAYSTMSQIGLMVMACGLGAFSVGMFHLYTHAFFKATLFLGAGAVLHALGGEEDMRKMGGLAKKLPFTFIVFLLATLALCGLPPFAGFFSKDEILWTAWAAAGGSPLLWLVGSLASFLTAFYMFRAVFMTFFGSTRVSAELQHHIHEPPPSMSVVLAVLALGAVTSGFIGLPQFWRELLGVSAPFYDFLAPVLGHATMRADVPHSAEFMLMLVAVAVALAGITLAWFMYGRGAKVALPGADRPSGNPLHKLVSNGYYFDAFYDGVVVRFAGLAVGVGAAAGCRNCAHRRQHEHTLAQRPCRVPLVCQAAVGQPAGLSRLRLDRLGPGAGLGSRPCLTPPPWPPCCCCPPQARCRAAAGRPGHCARR